jgi:hypothetical protein
VVKRLPLVAAQAGSRPGLLAGDAGQAEDLAQPALIRTYLAWHRLRDPASAEACARTVLLRFARRVRQRRWAGEIATGQLAELAAPSAGGGLVLDVRGALAGLPAGQRAVLVLRFLEDCGEAEMAVRLPSAGRCGAGVFDGTPPENLTQVSRSWEPRIPRADQCPR